jgi:hypothetical protein
METECKTRKRIWEVDCWSLDAALAGSFDWKEFINLLQSSGYSFDFSKSDTILELQAQCLVHEFCHSDNPISLTVERLLNLWHERVLEGIDSRTPSEVAQYVLTSERMTQKQYAGLFWALGCDSRSGFDCIRRRFHQRFGVQAIRKMA